MRKRMDLMAKAGELDWSELKKSDEEYDHTPTALWAADMYGGGKEGVDPLNKSEKRLKEGEVPYRPTDEEIRAAVMRNAQRQPTDEEMFGHLVPTEEQVQKAEDDWDTTFTGWYEAAQEDAFDEGDTAAEWNGREPLTKGMSEEELAKWRMHTD